MLFRSPEEKPSGVLNYLDVTAGNVPADLMNIAQGAYNVATDPLQALQGVAEAAGMGAVTGFAMGVGGGGSGHVVGRLQERRKEEQAKQADGLRAILEEQARRLLQLT